MSRAARRAVIKEGLKTLKMPSVLRDYEQKARQAQDAQWVEVLPKVVGRRVDQVAS